MLSALLSTSSTTDPEVERQPTYTACFHEEDPVLPPKLTRLIFH